MKGVLSLVSNVDSATNTLGLLGQYQSSLGLSFLIGNMGEGLMERGMPSKVS